MAIDIIFVILAGYGFYIGFSRGIIKTVFTVLAYLFGALAAFKFAPAATRFLETAFDSHNPLMFLAGFLLAFVATMLLIRMIARGLEGGLRTANINILNQFAGGIVMAALMILMYSMLLWFANSATLLKQSTKEQSFTYQYLDGFPEKVWNAWEYVQPSVVDFWEESVNFMDRIQEKSLEQTESDPNIFDVNDEEEAEPTVN